MIVYPKKESIFNFAFTSNFTDHVNFIKCILQCDDKGLVNTLSLYRGCRALSLAFC